MATDFGDDIGDAFVRRLNNILDTVLREWLMRQRYNTRNGNYDRVQEDGKPYAQFPCDSAEQQAAVVKALQEAGIDCHAADISTQPGVRVAMEDMGKFDDLLKQAELESQTLSDIDAPQAPDMIPELPVTYKQREYLDSLAEKGVISEDELNELADNYTIGKANEILNRHAEDLHLEKTGERPITQAQERALNTLKDWGIVSDKEIASLGEHPTLEGLRQLLDGKPITEKEILHHAYENGQISRYELQTGLQDAGMHKLADRQPKLVEKLSDAGYDMNDLTRNDARMRPSHDGMDPDAHTQQVEDSWKEQVRERLESIPNIENLNARELVQAARERGLNVMPDANGQPKFQLSETSLTHPGNWLSGSTLDERRFTFKGREKGTDPYSMSKEEKASSIRRADNARKDQERGSNGRGEKPLDHDDIPPQGR